MRRAETADYSAWCAFRDATVRERNLLQIIEDAENRARRCGCFITMHALNRAKNAIGWEMVGNLEMAAKAVRRGLEK
jgi:hypothetical protein